MTNVPNPGEPGPPAPPPAPFPEPKPVREPDPHRLPDEEPLPNPDENDNPPRHAHWPGAPAGARTRLHLRTLAFPLLLWTLATSPAFAQVEPQLDPPGAAECRALPEGVVPNDGETDEERRAREEELSQLLDRCDGVLAPPDIGESDMVEPPPDTGRTPIIRPEDLPSQPAGEPAQGG